MTFTKNQQAEVRQISTETSSDALQQMRQDILNVRAELNSLRETGTAQGESVNKLVQTMDRVLTVLSGDDGISKEPGLINRVRSLEKSNSTNLLKQAKWVGIGIGVLIAVKVLWSIIQAAASSPQALEAVHSLSKP